MLVTNQSVNIAPPIFAGTIAEQSDVASIIERLPNDWIISLGEINGRNVWKSDLVSVYKKLAPLYKTLGGCLWFEKAWLDRN